MVTENPKSESKIKHIVLYIKTLKLVFKFSPGIALSLTIVTIITSLLPASTIWVTKQIIDQVANLVNSGDNSEIFKKLLFWVGIEILLKILSTGLSSIYNFISQNHSERFSNYIQTEIINKCSKLDLAFFENSEFYNKLSLTKKGSSSQPTLLLKQLFQLLKVIIALITVLVLLIRFNAFMIPLIIIVALPRLIFEYQYIKKRYNIILKQVPESRKSNYYFNILSTDHFVKETKIFGLSNYLINSYKNIINKFYIQNREIRKKSTIVFWGLEILSTLFYYSFYLYIIFNITKRFLTVGDVSLYQQVFSQSQNMVREIFKIISSSYERNLYLNHLFEFLEMQDEFTNNGFFKESKQLITSPKSPLLIENIKSIEIDNVYFKYPSTQRYTLKNINMKSSLGEKIFLVGENGAGKTTLIKIICGLYKPTTGNIIINGKNINKYDLSHYRSKISVIFQDFIKYNLSVQENIGFGDLQRINNTEEIKNAAKDSIVDNIIDALPEKYDTYLGKWFQHGCQLSTGEWQKIALARSNFRKADLIIMDEPTAFLDLDTEQKVFNNLLKTYKNKTTILITHRLSYTYFADTIYVLKNNTILEKGNHDYLMNHGGEYFTMFLKQSNRFDTKNRSVTTLFKNDDID